MATKSNVKTVSIMLPVEVGGQPTEWVALNGKSWNIPRGVRVDVPEDVANILFNKEKNKAVQRQYEDQKQQEYDASARRIGLT